MVKDMLAPDFAGNANRETVKLKKDLVELLSMKGVTP